ncbi:MAG TPA: hypothetical protein VFO65_10440 [Acidimicrobiales bacterium]|nr:hypothetical protein [Acidimicrobiales bacterium]
MTGIEIVVTVAAVVVTLGGLGVLGFYFMKLKQAARDAAEQARAAADAVTELQRRIREQEAAGRAPGQAAAGPAPGGAATAPPAYRDQRGWPNL